MSMEFGKMPFHVLLAPPHHIPSGTSDAECSIFFLVPLIFSSLLTLCLSVQAEDHLPYTKNVPPNTLSLSFSFTVKNLDVYCILMYIVLSISVYIQGLVFIFDCYGIPFPFLSPNTQAPLCRCTYTSKPGFSGRL